MRKLAIVFLLALFAAVPALAQDRTQITVPFEFQVAEVTLPAGQYTLDAVDNFSMIIRAADTNVKPVRVVIREVASDKAERTVAPAPTMKVVFRMNNGHHVLHTVQTLSMTHAHDVVHAYADVQ